MDRFPYQRFLEQLCREGRDPGDILSTLKRLGYARLPGIRQIERICSELNGAASDELFDSEELKIALRIVKKPAAFEYARRAQRLDDEELIAVLKHKFKVIVTPAAVEAFRLAFWDLSSMSHMDAVMYFNDNREISSPQDRVPIRDAPDFFAYQDGEDVEIDVDRVFDELKQDAYFKYKQSLGKSTPTGQQEARRWGEFLMKVIKEEKAAKPPAITPLNEEKTPEQVELQYDDGDDDIPLIDNVPQPEEGV